ncbi:PAS domain-containing protein [Porifericola rhodea]|uniref:PAS domain-containing sensor histidine kinase n=1 Tax=Porifericola rhodea TaxID=930972 RepID=UPI0026669150|nr:PAS domain-containing protein [Porifericola rhodea]WKN33839.1 PAS domain-containing protein [Porifericola rhodea]
MASYISPILKDSQWFDQLYMQAPIAIGIYMGKEHTIAFANTLMYEIWGRSQEQVLNKPLFDALPEVREQGFEEILAKVLSSGEPFSGDELPATLERNGKITLCYFNIVYNPLRDEHGNIAGIIQSATEVTELVKSRQVAERNEEIIKTSLEAGKMYTWYLDFIEGTTTRSSGYEAIFGFKDIPQNWNLEQFFERIIEEDRPNARRCFEAGKKSGKVSYQARIMWPDKSIHWIQVKGQTAFNLKGQPISMSGVITDITEQKETAERERIEAMEEAIRKEEERQAAELKELFMNVPALIATLVGPHFVFDLVNPHYQALFPDRQLQGRPLLEAIPELKGQPIIDIVRDVYEKGETYTAHEMIIPLDTDNTGRMRDHFFTFMYQPMRNKNNEVYGIRVFAFEMTEQVQARQLAERSEERLRIALDAGDMGTWNYNMQDGSFTHSLQHDFIFGYDEQPSEWNYQSLLQHILPQDRNYVKKQFELAKIKGSLNIETRINTANDEEKWVVLRGKTFYEDEQPIRMTGVVMDVTEQKQRSIDLKRINTDLDNFVYTASHDLRAPITNLEGLMTALRKTILTKTDAREEKLLQMVDTSVDKLKKTITDLVEFTKTQYEDVQKRKEKVEFKVLLEEVKSDVQNLIDKVKPDIKVKLEVEELMYKRAHLRSILYNLLSNAIKYSAQDRHPVIEVSTYKEEETSILSIKDNGLGLSQEQQKKLFQMFKRFHNHVEGTGIGLYTIKRIIESNGGCLKVNSVQGEGSEFIVYF